MKRGRIRIEVRGPHLHVDTGERLWLDYGVLHAPPIMREPFKRLLESWHGTALTRENVAAIRYTIEAYFTEMEQAGYIEELPDEQKPRLVEKEEEATH